jgi:hypothetical protein
MSKMMRVRWLAAPYQARVLGEITKPSLDPEDCGASSPVGRPGEAVGANAVSHCAIRIHMIED